MLTRARADRGWSRRELARRLRAAAASRLDAPALPGDESLVRSIRRWESGEVYPDELNRSLLADAYGWPASLLNVHAPAPAAAAVEPDELDAELLELGLRAEASDVGRVALDAVDLSVADLARRYPTTPPADLLAAVRRRTADVVRMLDGKATLGQRRRLLVAGGWLSLLASTVHVDLGHRHAARLARDTAAALGREADEPELAAWAAEIATWEAIVERRWVDAVELARTGQQIAPRGRAAVVQLTAQEARAAARLGDSAAVYGALARTDELLREQPEGGGADTLHHFVFDPAKLVYYTATALSWLGDPAAEDYSREVLASSRAPRRTVTARIDLGMVLTSLGRPDEAAALGAQAVDSGWLVPSNRWRAGELVDELDTRYPDLPDAADLRERYQALQDRSRARRGPAQIEQDGAGGALPG